MDQSQIKDDEMAVDICSRLAYEGVNLGHRQAEILRFVQGSGKALWYNKKLSREMRRPINTITPRVKELRDQGIIRIVGRLEIDGRLTNIWKITKYIKETV